MERHQAVRRRAEPKKHRSFELAKSAIGKARELIAVVAGSGNSSSEDFASKAGNSWLVMLVRAGVNIEIAST
jgi:hypothetical protein